jgi:hypothetical protein
MLSSVITARDFLAAWKFSAKNHKFSTTVWIIKNYEKNPRTVNIPQLYNISLLKSSEAGKNAELIFIKIICKFVNTSFLCGVFMLL